MISINHLSKIIGNQTILNDVSFMVKKGEIAGFLGPNGAGKSTTMKVATGYISPTIGDVIVSGYNILDNEIKVKSKMGYLHEHNPLYTDMYVREFLGFAGHLSGMKSKQIRKRVEEVISICGLSGESKKQIGNLSKGYRQRVGLAQAIIHDPEVLILDEPTTGLDPNQIVEIRNLIRELGKRKTVLFSTHIMQEVHAICDRAIVINKGKIVADDSVDNLKKKGGGNTLIVELEEKIDDRLFTNVEGVLDVVILDGAYKMTINDEDVRSRVTKFINEKGWTLLEIRMVENTLDEIFKKLTTDV